jgi:hypothetical protein
MCPSAAPAAPRRHVVFLDYDGVVACTEESGWTSERFGPAAAAHLNALCGRWGADLVLTSSWRFASRLPGDASAPREAAARFLAARGVTAPLFPGDEDWAVPHLGWGDPDDMAFVAALHRRHGVNLPPRGVGNVVLENHIRRGDEVQTWLDLNLPDARPADWLLLDDEDDYWPDHMGRLVLCDPERGFDAAAYGEALARAALTRP